MVELIQVKAADPDRCALWEVNPDHPSGEAFVYGEQVFTVANTPLVYAKLRTGELVLVAEKPTEAPTSAAVEPPHPKRKTKA